ncbi:hypothetical protein THAOC_19148 [Thalassiosira oceanica]|uniref:Uncharacterized protein n=1 Tax=Thalassiosira oceanica TaxID=159749 RepID=K0S304_THAOC|nr:hypothetical protein THAOC_19148 [Thalassiosira oceanica]|eukprot:EJK60488.1 hypothetical protein THAOC_19148 [Thalassiosira oceanica]
MAHSGKERPSDVIQSACARCADVAERPIELLLLCTDVAVSHWFVPSQERRQNSSDIDTLQPMPTSNLLISSKKVGGIGIIARTPCGLDVACTRRDTTTGEQPATGCTHITTSSCRFVRPEVQGLLS